MWQNYYWIDFLIAALFVAAWYFGCLQLNRRRCTQILYWIDDALAGSARIAGFEWLSPSLFKVRLRFPDNMFRTASLTVRLQPRELPIRWLANRMRKQRETAVFEADLVSAPSFNMQIKSHRWVAHSRKMTESEVDLRTVEKLAPIVITSRREWPSSTVNVMEALTQNNCESELLSVRYNPRSPHFSATLPLEALAPESQNRTALFDTMKELALGASASRL